MPLNKKINVRYAYNIVIDEMSSVSRVSEKAEFANNPYFPSFNTLKAQRAEIATKIIGAIDRSGETPAA
jgi:hypothetical protein